MSKMYVRLKRKNQTVFLNVGPSRTIQSVKEDLSSLMSVPAEGIELFGTDKEKALEDASTIGDHGIATGWSHMWCVEA